MGPQISSHLSRHDMTCLSGSQISSHLSRFISDKSPPKIESFVERIVATKSPKASRRPRWIDRRRSNLQAVYWRHRRRDSPRSQRYIGRGHARDFGPAISAAPSVSTSLEARRRRLKFGRKGLGAILSHLVPGLDPYLGPRSQALSRIGANGIMVLRLRVAC